MFCELKCLEMTTFHSIQLHLPKCLPSTVTFFESQKPSSDHMAQKIMVYSEKIRGTHAHTYST